MSTTGYKIADGTDLLSTFQNVLTTTGNTFSNPSNVFYGDGSNLTGLTGPANMVTTDTAQTITALKTFSGTTGGIQLTNCCIAGRTDNFGFTGIPSGTTFQPIGYTINHISPPTALPPVATVTYYTGVPLVDAGVWIVNGGISILKGTAQWDYNFVSLRQQAIGGTISPGNASAFYFTNPAGNLAYNFPSSIFIARNTDRTSQVQPGFNMSWSTTGGTYTHAIQMTKIA